MNKTIFRIVTVILVSVAFYILSVNFIFKIPSPYGGYEKITYQVGFGIAILAGVIAAILLFVFNKRKK